MTAPAPDLDPIAVIHLRMILEALLEVAEDADKATVGLPDDLPLPALADLLADIDGIAAVLAGLREQVEARARAARGWTRNRAAWPEMGLRAERASSSNRRWDVPAVAARLAPLLRVDADGTGEVDVDLEPLAVERLLRRFLLFASVGGYRTTALKEAGVQFDDLLEVEPRPARVRVFRDPPGGGA